MTHEDRPAGPLLSRREVVTFLGATGMAWLMAGSINPKQAVAGTLDLHVWSDLSKPKVRILSTSA